MARFPVAALALVAFITVPPGAIAAPDITDLDPAYAWEGQTVAVIGTGFGPGIADNLVLFDGIEGEILSASPTRIEVRVPEGAHYGPLQVAYLGAFSNPRTFKAALPFAFDDLSTMGFDEVTGAIWATDQGSVDQVFKLVIDPATRAVTREARGSLLAEPNGLPDDIIPRFYVMSSVTSATNQGSIYRVGNTGPREFLRAAGSAGDPVYAWGVALENPTDTGNPAVFVAEKLGSRIRRVPRFGRIDANYATGLSFNDPAGMAVDNDRNLYVTSGTQLLKVDTLRRVTVLADGMTQPTGIFLTSDDDGDPEFIYIADKATGEILEYSFEEDKLTAVLDRLNQPRAVILAEVLGGSALWVAEKQHIVKADFGLKVSSVAFFPGFMGTRLYQRFGEPTKLWLGLTPVASCALRPDEHGEVSGDQYSQDVIETAVGPLIGQDVYGGWGDCLRGFETDDLIDGWDWFGYDWRLSVKEIADEGTSRILGRDDPMEMVEALAEDSQTGKVTLIGHSNGGLVIKELVLRMEREGKLGLIDRIILFASPQYGTPVGLGALLHGFGQGLPLIMPRSIAREIGETMIGGYTLLPSRKYFDAVSTPVVTFDMSEPAAEQLRKLRENYGATEYGNNRTGMRGLVLGKADDRIEPYTGPCLLAPLKAPMNSPNLGREELLDVAEGLHDDDLDHWVPPAGVEVFQVVGDTLPTLSGIHYTSVEDPKCREIPCPLVLAARERHSTQGDGTVIGPSAAAMPVDSFFFDLDRFNADKKTEFEHFNIVGASTMCELTEALLMGKRDFTSAYINTVARNGIRWVEVALRSPIDVHAYDDAGRHTGEVELEPGPDVDTANYRFLEHRIPNSTYKVLGDHRTITLDTREIRDIELVGRDFGVFTLEINEYVDEALQAGVKWVDVPTLPSLTGSLQVQTATRLTALSLDLQSDGTVDYVVTPAEGPQSRLWVTILGDIVRTLSLDPKFEQRLLKKLDKALVELDRGRPIKAAEKLEDFTKSVDKERDKERLDDEIAEGLLDITFRLASPMVPRPVSSASSLPSPVTRQRQSSARTGE